MRRITAILLTFLTAAPPALADPLQITNSFTPNTLIESAKVNQNFTDVATWAAGTIANDNIKASAGILLSKLAHTSELFVKMATGNRVLSGGITGDTIPRFSVSSDGEVKFGPGGASALDMMLKRSDANTLIIRNAGDTLNKNLTVGTLTADNISVSTPTPAASGGTGASTASANNIFAGPTSGGAAAPSFRVLDLKDMPTGIAQFGGSGEKAIPTSGTLTGEYWHNSTSTWTTTGTITCNRCRLHFRGPVVIDHDITVNPELYGGYGAGLVYKEKTGGTAGQALAGPAGQGLGGGTGGDSGTGSGGAGGSFGGEGGAGGRSSTSNSYSNPPWPYDIMHCLTGSGGGAGSTTSAMVFSGSGGRGGGSLYIEAVGAVTVNANISANGGAGSSDKDPEGSFDGGIGGAGGGGGSGGGIMILSQSTVTINAAKTISTTGGAGANAESGNAGGGGGGSGGYVYIRGSTVTNNGSVTATGGAGGTGNGTGGNGDAGATGVTSLVSETRGKRSAP